MNVDASYARPGETGVQLCIYASPEIDVPVVRNKLKLGKNNVVKGQFLSADLLSKRSNELLFINCFFFLLKKIWH